MDYSDPVDILAAIRSYSRNCRAVQYCAALLLPANRLIHILELYYDICIPVAEDELQAAVNLMLYPDIMLRMQTQAFPTIDDKTLVECLSIIRHLRDELTTATLCGTETQCARLKEQISFFCNYLNESKNASGENIDYKALTTHARDAVRIAIDRLITRIRPQDHLLSEIIHRSIVIDFRCVWIMQYDEGKEEE